MINKFADSPLSRQLSLMSQQHLQMIEMQDNAQESGGRQGMGTRRDLLNNRQSELNLFSSNIQFVEQQQVPYEEMSMRQIQNNLPASAAAVIIQPSHSSQMNIISQQNLSNSQNINNKIRHSKKSRFLKNIDEILKVKNVQQDTGFKFLNKVKIVKRFQQKLMQKKLLQMQLTNTHLKIIGDFAIVLLSEVQMMNICLVKKFFELLKAVPVFMPDNRYLIMWEIAALVLSLLQIMITPMIICFKTEEVPFLHHFMNIMIIVFFVDIIMQFNKAFYDNVYINQNRTSIFWKYAKENFCYDLLSTISLLIENQPGDYSLVQFFFVFRIFMYSRIKQKLIEDFHLFERFSLIIQMINLISLIFFMIHYTGLGFFFIAQNQDSSLLSWIDSKELRFANWKHQYVNSIYFSVISMCTIGYGDTVPISIYEKLYVIVISIISCGVFGYSINQIGTMFQEVNLKTSLQKKQKYELLKYMSNRQINKQLQIQVLKYIDFLAVKEEQSNIQGEQLLLKLSKHLRESVQKDYYGKILQENIFIKQFSREFIEQLTYKMNEIVLGPDEILFKKGDIENRFFFIQKGELQVYNIKNQQELVFGFVRQKQNNQYFEINSFIEGGLKPYSVKSKDITHIVYFTQQDFLNQLREFKKDYELFCYIKDQVIFTDVPKFKYCIICEKQGHQTEKCNIINFNPNKSLVFNKNNYSQMQLRIKLNRSKRKQFTFFKDIEVIKNSLKELRINLIKNNQNLNDSFYEVIEEVLYLDDPQFYQFVPEYVLPEIQILGQCDYQSNQSLDELDIAEPAEGTIHDTSYQQQASTVQDNQLKSIPEFPEDNEQLQGSQSPFIEVLQQQEEQKLNQVPQIKTKHKKKKSLLIQPMMSDLSVNGIGEVNNSDISPTVLNKVGGSNLEVYMQQIQIQLKQLQRNLESAKNGNCLTSQESYQHQHSENDYRPGPGRRSNYIQHQYYQGIYSLQLKESLIPQQPQSPSKQMQSRINLKKKKTIIQIMDSKEYQSQLSSSQNQKQCQNQQSNQQQQLLSSYQCNQSSQQENQSNTMISNNNKTQFIQMEHFDKSEHFSVYFPSGNQDVIFQFLRKKEKEHSKINEKLKSLKHYDAQQSNKN